MVHASFVGCSHLFLQTANFREIVIQDAGFPSQSSALSGNAALWFFEQGREDLTATTHGRQLNAIRRPGE